jgi:hypothetical protein
MVLTSGAAIEIVMLRFLCVVVAAGWRLGVSFWSYSDGKIFIFAKWPDPFPRQ